MQIIIYTLPDCKWCEEAKKLIVDRGWKYTEKVVGRDISVKEFEEGGEKSVPLIFCRNERIGGYEELFEHIVNTTGYGDG